jgi:phosphate transport system substrate-binding protein
MLIYYITPFIYKRQPRENKMKTISKIIIGVVVIAIIVGAAIGAVYLGNSNNTNSNTTPTPTASPTTSPTATPTLSPTTTATNTPGPTATTAPTHTPAPSVTPTQIAFILNGAGATFPAPFLNAVNTAYNTQKSWIQINYQGVGSGAGINSLTAKTVDFAASDAPLSDSQRAAAPNTLHIPETIGAVTLAYNLPGITGGLHLTGQVIANIYLGTITNWNDPAITALNPTTTLPNHIITTIHRSDSSGTTNVFTKYLVSQSSTWQSQVGSGTSVQWPGSNAAGQPGNAAVASTVSSTAYSIGYVELAYALQNSMTVASVQNPAGNYITPSLASTIAAVQSGASQGLPSGDQSWSSVSLLNTADPQAYPIVTFTYLLEYKELNVLPGMTQERALAIVQYLWYVVHDGQSLAPGLSYATLPSNVVTIDEASIKSITYNGQTFPTS